MGVAKLLVFLLLFSFAFLRSGADVAVEGVNVEPEGTESSLQLELEQLRSKISILESSIVDKTRELKSKNENIALMGKIIQKKSDDVNSLQREVESIQKRGALNDVEVLENAHARSAELEKQMEKLKDEILVQAQKKHALESRASGADKKLDELNLKLATLQKTNDEQKKRIQKTEHALKVAEEELVKAQLETASKKKELVEIHGAWLPSWLAIHLGHCQESAITHWNQLGKPAFNAFLQKASDISGQALKHVEPHWDTAKTSWLPALKEKWIAFSIFIEPHVQLVSTRTSEFYEASLSSLKPHVARVQELSGPYFQEAKKFSKPYVDQVATITKPHVQKVRVALKPYTQKVVHAYGKFLKSATSYHSQVQAVVQDKLKKHKVPEALTTKELVWFTASTVLALPIYLVYVICKAIFCRKPNKSSQSSQASHTYRRHKKRHS